MEPDEDGQSLIEKSIRYANKLQQEESSSQASLFGGEGGGAVSKPKVSRIEPYGEIEKLNIEKEIVGLYISGHPLDQYRFEMENLCSAKIGDLKELDKLRGRELRMGGIVSDVQHRLTKKGKPFGQLTLEDYNDNHSFFLFGENYLNFKTYLEKGWFLYITGSVVNRWNSDEPEFKIQTMEYLGDIREKLTKGLELQTQIQYVNESMVAELERLTDKYPGKSLLRLSVMSQFEDRPINLEMMSRKLTISPSDELMKELAVMNEFKVKVLLN